MKGKVNNAKECLFIPYSTKEGHDWYEQRSSNGKEWMPDRGITIEQYSLHKAVQERLRYFFQQNVRM